MHTQHTLHTVPRSLSWLASLSTRLRALLLLACLLFCGGQARAQGMPGTVIYWTNFAAGSIGRANLDGTGVTQNFIAAPNPRGVAVGGNFIYWCQRDGTIHRANLDGTGNTTLLTGLGLGTSGIAVNGTHLFWTNADGGNVGRANLDGTAANSNFITGGSRIRDVALNGTHIFWTNYSGTTIGRANLDGTGVNGSFLAVQDRLDGVFVDANYIYWSRAGAGDGTTLGRAALDGTGRNDAFISGAGVPVGGTVTATHLYWANGNFGSIGRANVDGSGVNHGFIPTASRGFGLEVGAGYLTPEPPSLVVTTTSDASTAFDHLTSLREALHAAEQNPGADTITFAPQLSGTLTMGDQWTNGTAASVMEVFNHEVTIQGPTSGPGITIHIASGANRRHFYVYPGGNLTLSHLTLTGGTGEYGGSVWSQGSLTVRNCTFTDNTATNEGGAIHSWADSPLLVVENSTLAGNTSQNIAGALDGGAVTMSLTNVTVVDNTATNGGAVVIFKNAMTMVNCIVARNTNDGALFPNGGSFTASTNNLLGVGTWGGLTDGIDGNRVGVTNVGLGVLADNGGPTQTVALLPNSPALNAGAAVALTTDQRGQRRVVGSAVDIGAVEAAPARLYVDADVSGGDGSGDDWPNAFAELRDAVAIALGNPTTTEIWVTNGTYKPTGGSDRNATFRLRNGLAIYGGFAGTEMNLNERNPDPATNGAALSGDLNGDDATGFTNNGENSYHVTTGTGTNNSAILDGFTIRGGNANSDYPNNFGGGMLNENFVATNGPTLANLIFTSNSCSVFGGAMQNFRASPTLTNVTFSGNSSGNSGGGISNNSSSPTLTNVTFSGNSSGNSGGGICNGILSNPTLTNVTFSGNSANFGGGGICNGILSNPTLTNVTFSGNSATQQGGGIYNDTLSSPTLTNVTFSGNSASNSGGGIYNQGSPALRNCILWGNGGGEIVDSSGSTTISHSIVQGGFSGSRNEDPKFVDSPNGNLRLRAGSPAINMGDNDALPTTDLDGNPRIVGGTVDMGAYESGLVPITPTPGRYIGSGADALGAFSYAATGRGSGYITVGGMRYSFLAKFLGTPITVNAKRTGFTPIPVTITAGTGDGLHAQLRLSYTDPLTSQLVEVDISRTAYDSTNPCPFAGNWKVAFRNSAPVGAPPVCAVGNVIITSTGSVRIVGSTVNRKVFTRGTVMINPATIPFYMNCIRATTQTLQGTLEFAGDRMTGDLRWVVPAGADPAFANAIDEDYTAFGSRFAALPLTAQTGVFTLTNPSITGPVTGTATLQPSGRITGIPRVFGSISRSGGLNGSHIESGVITRFSGVYLPVNGEIIGFTRQGDNFGEVNFALLLP